MRKAVAKLALRQETLRALSDIDLVPVVRGRGGDALLAGDVTRDKVCPFAMALRKP